MRAERREGAFKAMEMGRTMSMHCCLLVVITGTVEELSDATYALCRRRAMLLLVRRLSQKYAIRSCVKRPEMYV
jgi:hypothetical protein